jgi:hypothetical protein
LIVFCIWLQIVLVFIAAIFIPGKIRKVKVNTGKVLSQISEMIVHNLYDILLVDSLMIEGIGSI